MNRSAFKIMAPAFSDASCSETELLGAATWLWLHSASHRSAPIQALTSLLLPAIAQRQVVLGVEDDKPVFYASWAKFSAEAESRYLRNHPAAMRAEDWSSGDRLWIIDWIAPFGHTARMHRFFLSKLFQRQCFQALYHRGDERGMRILRFRGISVMREEADAWFQSHPVVLPSGNPPSSSYATLAATTN